MSRRIFAQITQTGICDEKGRAAATYGWKGRVIGVPNRPVTSLIEALLGRINDMVGWDSITEAEADIAEAVAVVKRFGEGLDDPVDRKDGDQ